MIQALKSDPKCQDIQFEVLNFSHRPDLKFLRDEIVQQLPILPHDPSRKLVLLIRGLEKSIGVDLQGDYPPVLQDLNFVRDAYKRSVPHPLLFILPDYALTRLTKFAPDFWAWRSGVFLFQTPQTTKDYALVQTLEADRPIDSSKSPESSERIALLESLLMDYRPSAGHPPTDIDLNTCNILLHQLGVAYLSQRNATKAQNYLENALELAQQRQDVSLAAEIYQDLGRTFAHRRSWEQARLYFQQALEIFIEYGDRYSQAGTLHCLGMVAAELREWEQAQSYYQQAIEIFIEYGDRYSQAGTLHNLGIVAGKLREWEQARSYYQQALEIKIEYGAAGGTQSARFSQASTLHNLGAVAYEEREWEQARLYFQQALEIFIEYGERFSQASTLHHLGMVAQELREWEQARLYFQQALEIYIEYGDRYEQAGTLHQLGIVAEGVGELSQAKSYYLQALQIWAEFNDGYTIQTFSLPRLVALYRQTQDEEILVGIASVFGVGVEELRGLLEG
ncbi:tetratricopeptide repeat family protein [Microcystis aeruginosa FACHB-905 = DIANCHI905]|nr:tetratricopeptide repeat family protein [Microcystis aeruginosa FACHB-905 = DIANCHI905]